MADSATRQPVESANDQSLGALVSQAVKDVTQLLRFELDLAKLELKADVRRLSIAGALLVIAAFVACLVLMLVSFSFAYGLIALGIYAWAAFLIVAGTYVLLAALAVLIGMLKFRGLSGLKKTRLTVQDDLSLIRRDGGPPSASTSAAVSRSGVASTPAGASTSAGAE
jgi:uncharacterized membrane protein YqjE